MSASSYQTPGAGVSAIDQLTRKRARKAESHPSTGEKRPKQKILLPMLSSESYMKETEGVSNDTSWGDPSRCSPAMLLGSQASWDQHDVVASTTSSSFATHDIDLFAISAPSAEITYPIFTHQGGIFDSSGNDDGSASRMNGETFSNKSLKKWTASTDSIAPTLSLPPFVSHPSHLPMSYTDVHNHNQSTDSIESFSPRNNVAEPTPGFTSPYDIMNTSFGPLLVDIAAAPTLLHGTLHVSGDDTSLSAFALHDHPGHAQAAEHYFGGGDSRIFPGRESWYGQETPENSLALTTNHLAPTSRLSFAGELRFDSGPKAPALTLVGPHFHPHMIAVGEKKAERLRRPRGQLPPKDREETSKTRKWKACIRCRMQKIRCIPDPGNPETECCLCCKKVLNLETKKVIHRIPCFRWNLNEVVLFRVGGLGLTKRWSGLCVENIDSCDWANERIITIGVCITKLPCDPIQLNVRRFIPNSTDIQHRHYKDQTTEVVITTPAYALADVNSSAEEYRRYVWQNSEEAIRRFVKDQTIDECVRQTFSIALRHAARAAHKEFGKVKGNPAKLFRNYFRLWFASRFTLGSAYVADGAEKLEGTSASSLYGGKHFVSRMITAQFDSIGYKYVLVKLKREVLDELWLLMQKRTDTTFFTVYLIVFMMLHEVSITCQDRRRRAKEQGLTTYYDLEEATAKIKHGADIILGHWHYYKGDLDPLSMSESSISRCFGTDSTEEIRLLMATCRKYAQMGKNSKKSNNDETDDTGTDSDNDNAEFHNASNVDPTRLTRFDPLQALKACQLTKMSDQDTFTLLPLQIDPQTKAISTTSVSRTLQAELSALNSLHRTLLSLETPNNVPPPPIPVNPKRSANISKLRDNGNAEHRKGHHEEAIKLYTFGLQMALARPPWEPQGLVREEVAALYANRAQSYIALQAWPEGAIDAEASVEAKRAGNSKAWWRRGKCLMEMGRLDEAQASMRKALESEGQEPELVTLLREIDARLARSRDAAAAAFAAK
ncbi:hypothetical protein GGS21DRAFT_486264 [Xylaria nigripes]|nr:hypothetical protein GGS21DRAFT_486264 [Xylaria nigripes]